MKDISDILIYKVERIMFPLFFISNFMIKCCDKSIHSVGNFQWLEEKVLEPYCELPYVKIKFEIVKIKMKKLML